MSQLDLKSKPISPNAPSGLSQPFVGVPESPVRNGSITNSKPDFLREVKNDCSSIEEASVELLRQGKAAHMVTEGNDSKRDDTMRSSVEGLRFGGTIPSKDKPKESSIIATGKPAFIQSQIGLNSVQTTSK